MNKSELKPALVFEQFAKINEIPRPSKHEENMIEFLKSFGEAHQLETLVDETGNVLIRKAATPGYEHAETIILQSHMDMVCDKLVEVDFDFHKDAIQTYVDGECYQNILPQRLPVPPFAAAYPAVPPRDCKSAKREGHLWPELSKGQTGGFLFSVPTPKKFLSIQKPTILPFPPSSPPKNETWFPWFQKVC